MLLHVLLLVRAIITIPISKSAHRISGVIIPPLPEITNE